MLKSSRASCVGRARINWATGWMYREDGVVGVSLFTGPVNFNDRCCRQYFSLNGSSRNLFTTTRLRNFGSGLGSIIGFLESGEFLLDFQMGIMEVEFPEQFCNKSHVSLNALLPHFIWTRPRGEAALLP